MGRRRLRWVPVEKIVGIGLLVYALGSWRDGRWTRAVWLGTMETSRFADCTRQMAGRRKFNAAVVLLVRKAFQRFPVRLVGIVGGQQIVRLKMGLGCADKKGAGRRQCRVGLFGRQYLVQK